MTDTDPSAMILVLDIDPDDPTAFVMTLAPAVTETVPLMRRLVDVDAMYAVAYPGIAPPVPAASVA